MEATLGTPWMSKSSFCKQPWASCHTHLPSSHLFPFELPTQPRAPGLMSQLWRLRLGQGLYEADAHTACSSAVFSTSHTGFPGGGPGVYLEFILFSLADLCVYTH